MEYTVQKLASLAGVSARTLRYYDQIGLLKPARITTSGYRIYGQREVDLLQQILFYRELEVPLDQIAQLLTRPEQDRLSALREHHQRLLQKRARIDALIHNVRRSISAEEGGFTMRDSEKFEGFKREIVNKNEELYGEEIRRQYGDGAVNASNAKLMGLDKEQYADMERLGERVLQQLDAAFANGAEPTSDAARELVQTHRDWLGFTFPQYTPQAHIGLGEMYAGDERFAAYYDRGMPGKACFLCKCIAQWVEKL